MKRAFVCVPALVLAQASCGDYDGGKPEPAPVGTLIAIELERLEPDSSFDADFVSEGFKYRIRNQREFSISELGLGTDASGGPAIRFGIMDDPEQTFEDWTRARVSRPVALQLKGEPSTFTIANVGMPLPNRGILTGNAGGLTEEEVERILRERTPE